MRSDDPTPAQPDQLHNGHLNDDELMEIYILAAESRHLSACGLCRSRYDSLTRSLAQLREDALREADAVFTSERLTEQRDRILRRIERYGHPAEVVRFPIRSGAVHHARAALGPAKRWVAGAAAAGLVAGLFLGHFVEGPVRVRMRGQAATRSLSAPQTVASWQNPELTFAPFANDDLLVEIEDTLETGRLVELGVLDAMMPVELQDVGFDGR
jgi:positive regulator of sigma E activity